MLNWFCGGHKFLCPVLYSLKGIVSHLFVWNKPKDFYSISDNKWFNDVFLYNPVNFFICFLHLILGQMDIEKFVECTLFNTIVFFKPIL